MPVAAAEQGSGAAATLDVDVTGFRNDHGLARVLVCPADSHFPDCGVRGKAASAEIAGAHAHVHYTGLAPGRYAVAVFHDEDRSGHMKTMLGIPLSGYGFSGNPPLRARAPRFEESAIEVGAGSATSVKLRYLF